MSLTDTILRYDPNGGVIDICIPLYGLADRTVYYTRFSSSGQVSFWFMASEPGGSHFRCKDCDTFKEALESYAELVG